MLFDKNTFVRKVDDLLRCHCHSAQNFAPVISSMVSEQIFLFFLSVAQEPIQGVEGFSSRDDFKLQPQHVGIPEMAPKKAVAKKTAAKKALFAKHGVDLRAAKDVMGNTLAHFAVLAGWVSVSWGFANLRNSQIFTPQNLKKYEKI